jgi:hypothetical protein
MRGEKLLEGEIFLITRSTCHSLQLAAERSPLKSEELIQGLAMDPDPLPVCDPGDSQHVKLGEKSRPGTRGI